MSRYTKVMFKSAHWEVFLGVTSSATLLNNDSIAGVFLWIFQDNYSMQHLWTVISKYL